MAVNRNEKGQLLPGSVLNKGGRAVTREQTFGKAVWVATGEGQTLRQALMDLVGKPTHKDHFGAVCELLKRTLGPGSKVPFLDEDATPEFTPTELDELLTEAYAAMQARKSQENPNALRPDERKAPQDGAVQAPGVLHPEGKEPER